ELEDCGRRSATHRPWRSHFELFEVVGKRSRSSIENPAMVLLVDGDAGESDEHPMVGERFRPERIDFEPGRLHSAWCLGRYLRLARAPGDAERHEESYQAHLDDGASLESRADHGRFSSALTMRCDRLLRSQEPV